MIKMFRAKSVLDVAAVWGVTKHHFDDLQPISRPEWKDGTIFTFIILRLTVFFLIISVLLGAIQRSDRS